MLDFLRKYKRQMLAIMGVFLMITFIIPNYDKYKDEFSSGYFGTIDGVDIQKNDVDLAKRDLDAMSNYLTDNTGLNPMGDMIGRHVFGRYLMMEKLYIDQANALARLMLTDTKDRDISYYVRQFADLEADYDARHEYWLLKLPDSTIKAALLTSSQRMAKMYFKTFNEEFIPAVTAGNKAKATEILEGPLASSSFMHLYTLQQLEEQAFFLATSLARQFHDKPLDYYILLNEARKMNIQVDQNEVNQIVDKYMRANVSMDYKDYLTSVVNNWVMVMGAFERYAAIDRQSPISSAYQYLGAGQKAKFQVVEFKASEFQLNVSPTTAQLNELFDKYKDKNPRTTDDGLGYLYPNRVRIHYIKIPYELALKSVTADEAAEYYFYNQRQAPTTRPATKEPSTQPVSDVPMEWKLDNETDKWARKAIAQVRVASIAKEIQQGMNAEWSAYKEQLKIENDPIKKENEQLKIDKKPLKTEILIPRDPPKTELGAPYLTQDKAHELEFLEKLKLKIEESKEAHGVKLTVIGKNDLISADEMKASMPDIAFSRINNGEYVFNEYITRYVEQLADEKTLRAIEKNPQIQLLEIGRASRLPFSDNDGNMYVFRVVEADKSHAPGSLDEVKGRVESDWNVLQSYDLAKKAAEKFFADAKANGFEKAAENSGKKDKLIRTDWIRRSLLPMVIKDIPSVTPDNSADFVVNAFKTYSARVLKKDENTIVNFGLPKITTAYVVGIVDAESSVIPNLNKKNDILIQTRTLPMNIDWELVYDWFDSHALRERNKFKSNERQ